MDFDDLIGELAPPPNRVGRCNGDREHGENGLASKKSATRMGPRSLRRRMDRAERRP